MLDLPQGDICLGTSGRNNNLHLQLAGDSGPVKAEEQLSTQLTPPADGLLLPPGVHCGKGNGGHNPEKAPGSQTGGQLPQAPEIVIPSTNHTGVAGE